jgi:hypothetical protein
MYLTLPILGGRNTSKVTLTHCLDAFVRAEVMEKSDAWYVEYPPPCDLSADLISGTARTARRYERQPSN